MVINDTGKVFVGNSTEPDTFTDPPPPRPKKLSAAIFGVHAGDHVQFTKTYDGSGGYNHSVRYGRYGEQFQDYRHLVNRHVQGQFTMTR